MAAIFDFVSRDVLMRRAAEKDMPRLEQAFASCGYPTFALRRRMFPGVLCAMLSLKSLSTSEAIASAWYVVDEISLNGNGE